LGKTGVVGTLRRGEATGKAIGLRADMDALDIAEENEFSHRSETKGKMHACGHDGHMAMLLGAAQYLSTRGAFKGTVHFIFQPAEENEGGGKSMIDDGLFELFPCEAVFGMHNFPRLPEGFFATRTGPMMAAFDIFRIVIRGVGGHAAVPHVTRDPILASSHLINMLQSIVSRNVNPLDSAVVSVTRLDAGTNYNVIPHTVTIMGTTRHFQPHVQDLVEKRIREIVNGVALSMGVEVDLTYERRYPATVNSGPETAQAIQAAEDVAGKGNVIADMPSILGSEDFAFMLLKRPGAYIGLGSGAPRKNGMLHQAGYDFNDALLPIGASYWVRLVERLLA
ncbi:MAG: M20 family metallopeptidase, partial [Syntrophales bacterium]|nr:M20 family metallopeptidase [Syntrophales bacterium]